MNYSLCNRLGRGARSQDPSAADYIALVRAAGATVDSNQVGEINNFYRTAKSTGYYTSLKRLYLPIWGVAAANAIDMIGGTSGTFNGGVTHAAGFVQGNRSTGYFDMGVNFTGAGLSQNNHMVGGLVYVADTVGTGNMSVVGNIDSSAEPFLFNIGGANHSFYSNDSYSALAISKLNGIFVGSRTGAAIKDLTHRGAAGLTTNSATTATTGASGLTNNFTSMACSQGGVMGYFSDAKLSAYFIGTGINLSLAESFTLHLKTLFESCTGLTLP